MATFSARPTLATMKQTVLKTIKGLVSKKLYRGIELLFQPCCHPVVKSASAECDLAGNTVITVELLNSINLYASGEGRIFLSFPSINIFIAVKTIYTDSNSLVFQFLNPAGPGSLDASIELYMPTSSDGLVGVSLSSEPFNIDLPNCGLT